MTQSHATSGPMASPLSTLLLIAFVLGCAADAHTPRAAAGLRCGTRPPLVLRALRLQGGAGQPESEEDDAEEEVEEADTGPEDAEAAEDGASEGDTPEVEEPDDPAEQSTSVASPAPPSLKTSLMSMLSSLGLSPSAAATGDGADVAEGAEDESGELFSTLLTVVVFVGLRVVLSLAMRYFGRPVADGGATRIDQLSATLAAGPLGPLVKAVQDGWASVAALSRSSYAAPVVMGLCIVALKLVGSTADYSEAADGPEGEAKAVSLATVEEEEEELADEPSTDPAEEAEEGTATASDEEDEE